MKMKIYNSIWLLALIFLSYEYFALNFNPHLSLLLSLQQKGILRDSLKISTDPGRPLSLWLGWLGLGFMILMNLYSMRKRIGAFQKYGKLSSWLNFHVFCGLIGPTFILFHCNFKVRGIVGISFWSMVVSFSSGIIGRYFYVQMLRAKVDLINEAEKIMSKLKNQLEKNQIAFDQAIMDQYVNQTMKFVGVPEDVSSLNPIKALVSSMAGDLRRMISEPAVPTHWPPYTKKVLTEIAVQKRRALFLESFQSLMGYWHTFHFPFAVFMYVAAVIHVAAALVFGI